MMNLLARILSHGFAFAVVALIILVLMYRGEFPVWELPESLAIKGLPGASEEADTGTVDRTAGEAEQPADVAVAIPPEVREEPLLPASATGTHEETQPADLAPAADAEPPAGTEPPPATVVETAAETTDAAVAGESRDTAGATDSQPLEVGDVPPATVPVESDSSTLQGSDDVSAQMTADIPGGPDDAASEESVRATEAAPEPTDADSGGPGTVQTPDDTTTAETATATATTVDTAPAAATEVPVPAEATATAMEQTDSAPAATEESATAADSLPAAEQLAAPVDQAAPQAVVGTVSESPYEVMAKAREAFWLRDFEVAEQQYRKLTQLEPDNPDGYGEMGNMYFSQGKWEEAAAAYYQAGARLLSDGLIQEARQMVDVIRGLNGAQADDLEAQINAASASSP
jgi:hypothetical protein